MANHRSIYVGTYIELENDFLLEDYVEYDFSCMNESCENNSNKNSGTFCPNCGSPIFKIEKIGKKKVGVDVYTLCEELFKNGDQFYKNDNFVFGNMKNQPFLSYDHIEDICKTFFDLFNILETRSEKDFKILSEKLNAMGYKNSIKAGIVSYWS